MPSFLSLRSEHGHVSVTWPQSREDLRAHIIVALRPIEEGDLEAFWAGELDNDLIRYPVEARSGRAELHLPAGRLIQLLLVYTDEEGERAPAPTLSLSQARPTEERQNLPGPVRHPRGPARDVPLIFANDAPPPGFERLARQIGHGLIKPGEHHLEVGAFGAHQRWTLTRLGWDAPAGSDLVLVVREQVVRPETVRAWEKAPPADALELPPGCDGVVDAEASIGRPRYYVLLAGPMPWRALPLSPVAPPFDTLTNPFVLGDLGEGLAAGVEALTKRLEDETIALMDIAPLMAMLEGALSLLPNAHPLRERASKLKTRMAPGGHL